MNPHITGTLNSLHLAVVIENTDPENRGRIRVRLVTTQMELWASVVTPSAGKNYGVSFIPRMNEIVVIAFVSPEVPLVLGSVWSGSDSRPQEADPQEEHYLIHTKGNTVLDFHDGNDPKVKLTTRSGYHITIDEADNGKITLERGEQNITLGTDGIDIRSTQGNITVNAGTLTVNAASVTVNASVSRFSGVVQADTVIATSVVGTSYTPGAGNIW